MYIIVAINSNSEPIEKIIKSFENQSVLPDFVLFVLDRINAVTKKFSDKFRVDYVYKKSGRSFDAGATRDYGLQRFEEITGEINDVLFLDGDCIPNEFVISEHLENLKRIENTPIVSCGRRVCYDKNQNPMGDIRDNFFTEKTNKWFFDDKNGKLLHSNFYHNYLIATHSCNLALNKEAIDICRRINKRLQNWYDKPYIITDNENRVFNSKFDGNWGAEDNFIGNIIFATGGFVFSTSKYSYVTHKYHESSSKLGSFNNWRKCNALTEKLYQYLLKDNVLKDYVLVDKIEDFKNPNDKFIEIPYLDYDYGLVNKMSVFDDCFCGEIISKISNVLDFYDEDYKRNYLKMFFCRYVFFDSVLRKEIKDEKLRLNFFSFVNDLLSTFITIEKGIIHVSS